MKPTAKAAMTVVSACAGERQHQTSYLARSSSRRRASALLSAGARARRRRPRRRAAAPAPARQQRRQQRDEPGHDGDRDPPDREAEAAVLRLGEDAGP